MECMEETRNGRRWREVLHLPHGDRRTDVAVRDELDAVFVPVRHLVRHGALDNLQCGLERVAQVLRVLRREGWRVGRRRGIGGGEGGIRRRRGGSCDLGAEGVEVRQLLFLLLQQR